MAEVIKLPECIEENGMSGLLNGLGKANDASQVVIDFRDLEIIVPGGVVALLAKLRSWQFMRKKISLHNVRNSQCFRHLLRNKFFRSLELDLSEDSDETETTVDLIPCFVISPQLSDIGPKATHLARCVVPNPEDREVRLLLEYAAGEAIANCKQHAHTRGYAAGEYLCGNDMAHIAVADHGKGILASFRDNQSPHYWEEMTDRDALAMALQPEVSSTTHFPRTPYSAGSPNRGVGLSMMHKIVEDTHGYMFLASGDAWYFKDGNNSATYEMFERGCHFQGTVCAVSFQRGQIDDYQRMIKDARIKLGLQTQSPHTKMFQ